MMKRLLLTAIFYFLCSLFIPAVVVCQESHRSLPGYKIENSGLRAIVKEFIFYEREHCQDYSIDWRYVVQIEKKTEDNYNVVIYSLQLTSDVDHFLDMNEKKENFGCLYAFGHCVFLEDDFIASGLFSATGNSYTFRYQTDEMFGSWPEVNSDMYLYLKTSDTFTLVDRNRMED